MGFAAIGAPHHTLLHALPTINTSPLPIEPPIPELFTLNARRLQQNPLRARYPCKPAPSPNQVRQAAVYGLGVCAQYGGPVFAGAAPQASLPIHPAP